MAKWIEDPQGRLEVEKVTEELKLPVWKANYKGKFREFWNECWEKIEDSFLKIKKSNEGKEPAITTKETAFNKPFGVSEDTILEGNKFTQMTGKDYGGILNITGQKEAGKAYWDNNTKKLYICKNNNSDISPNVNNYIPFDSNSLLERLENLKRNEYQIMYAGGSPVPVGTSGKLPDYVTYNNILDYYFKIRFFGGVSFYVVLDNSTNTNIVDYRLFNGIKFQLDINTNILKLIADPNREFISMSVFNKLT